MTQVRIYPDLCKGVEECGICVYICPKKLFRPSGALNPRGYRPPEFTEEDLCTGCENCMLFCPDLAIAVREKKRKKGVRS